jgi:hypothetical protein
VAAEAPAAVAEEAPVAAAGVVAAAAVDRVRDESPAGKEAENGLPGDAAGRAG